MIIDTPKGYMTLSDAGKEYGINRTTLCWRIKNHWPKEKLLSEAGEGRRLNEVVVDTPLGAMTINEACAASGVSLSAMYGRVRRSCPIEKILDKPEKCKQRKKS